MTGRQTQVKTDILKILCDAAIGMIVAALLYSGVTPSRHIPYDGHASVLAASIAAIAVWTMLTISVRTGVVIVLARNLRYRFRLRILGTRPVRVCGRGIAGTSSRRLRTGH